MVFSSSTFLVLFFPILFCGYYILSFSRGLQNLWIVLGSLIFYAWGEPVYIWLLLFCIAWNYILGIVISRLKSRKKLALFFAVAVDVGILFYYKYFSFFFGQVVSFTGWQGLKLSDIAIPMGISLYTFSSISYIVEVYRDSACAVKNPIDLGVYISFFSKLNSGPVVRFVTLKNQIRNRRFSWEMLSNGSCKFMAGLVKKFFLASNLAVVSDLVFNWSEMGSADTNVSILMAWLGILAFTLQVYFEFSGYSDIARGMGMIFGFEFEDNFKHPYVAANMTDFWNRWNTKITTWFREYVYYPLCGAHSSSEDVIVKNMLIVWLLIGMWHGVGWHFIIWGLWHFIFLIIDKSFRVETFSTHTILARIYTIVVVMMGWVFFRAKDLTQSYIYFKNLLGLNQNGLFDGRTLDLFKECWIFLVLGILGCLPIFERFKKYKVLNLAPLFILIAFSFINIASANRAVYYVGNLLTFCKKYIMIIS